MNPKAVSPVGAEGLLQLMPGTAEEIGVKDSFDVEDNVQGAINYLHTQYDHFPEIPDEKERIKFALASYVGGRGYVNKALQLAQRWDKAISRKKRDWEQWDYTRQFLFSPQCVVDGKKPDAEQIIEYVEKIYKLYNSS
jgi:membrane-bound lytic murein transglycosylase MltF